MAVDESAFEAVVTCPNCASPARTVIIRDQTDILLSIAEQKCSFWRCESCGIVYLSPRPKRDSIHLFYPADRYNPAPVSYQEEELTSGPLWIIRRAIWRLGRSIITLPYRIRFGVQDAAFPPVGQKKLLDVGCGNGQYLVAMKELGWQVYGCDTSQAKIDYLQQVRKLQNTYFGAVNDLHFPDSYFDVITLWHVIEHLFDPFVELDTLFRLLRPGGLLLIGTPNFRSLEANIFGRWWTGYDVPRHLILFCAETLTQVLTQKGFRVTRIRPSCFPTSVSDSIIYFLKERFGLLLWGSRLHKTLYLFLYPLAILSYCLGNWAILEVTSVKESYQAE